MPPKVRSTVGWKVLFLTFEASFTQQSLLALGLAQLFWSIFAQEKNPNNVEVENK